MSDLNAFAEAFRKLRTIKDGSDSKISIQTIATKTLAKAEIEEADRKVISECMFVMTIMLQNHPRRKAVEEKIEEVLARYGVGSTEDKKEEEGRKDA